MSGRLKNVLDSVVKVVNRIKSNPFQERLFRQLCADVNEKFKSLLLHTEVRWLSKGNCLNRFVELSLNVELFLNGTEVGKEVIAAKSNIFYQADIFKKLNILNKQLQGRNANILNCKEVINAFLKKLCMFKTTIRNKIFLDFPNPATLEKLHDKEIEIYFDHLTGLHDDMEIRF